MRFPSLVALFAATALWATPVYADDDDWFDDYDSEESDDEWERFDEDDSEIDMDDDPEEIDEEGTEDESSNGNPDDGFDLLEEEIAEDRIGDEGEDTAKIYRSAQDKAHDLGFEEELIFWGQYLERYPKSLFSWWVIFTADFNIIKK